MGIITEEEWRPIKGNEWYEVSDRGRVRSLDRFVVHSNGGRFFWKGRILKPGAGTNGYYFVGLPGRRNALVHRLVAEAFLGVTKGHRVDHADGDKQNNCLWNLRVCSQSQNCGNMKMPKRNTSGFKGVCWSKRYGKWQAHICCEGKKKHLGYFDSKEEAAAAYDAAALEYFGPFAKTNASLGLLPLLGSVQVAT